MKKHTKSALELYKALKNKEEQLTHEIKVMNEKYAGAPNLTVPTTGSGHNEQIRFGNSYNNDTLALCLIGLNMLETEQALAISMSGKRIAFNDLDWLNGKTVKYWKDMMFDSIDVDKLKKKRDKVIYGIEEVSRIFTNVDMLEIAGEKVKKDELLK